jgi:hypothetical protein
VNFLNINLKLESFAVTENEELCIMKSQLNQLFYSTAISLLDLLMSVSPFLTKPFMECSTSLLRILIFYNFSGRITDVTTFGIHNCKKLLRLAVLLFTMILNNTWHTNLEQYQDILKLQHVFCHPSLACFSCLCSLQAPSNSSANMVAWNVMHFPFPSCLHYMLFLLTAPAFKMVRVCLEELTNNTCDGLKEGHR